MSRSGTCYGRSSLKFQHSTKNTLPPPSLQKDGAVLPTQSVPELSSQKLSRQTCFIGPINPCQSDTGTPNKELYLEAVIIWLPGEKPLLLLHRHFPSNKALSSPNSAWQLFLTAQRWNARPRGDAAVLCRSIVVGSPVRAGSGEPLTPLPHSRIFYSSRGLSASLW